MKKIILSIMLFSFQINFTCSTPRIIRRTCHLHYTDEDYRKSLGNRYLQEAIRASKQEKSSMTAQPTTQTDSQVVTPKLLMPRTISIPSKFDQPKLDGLLKVQSLLPSIHRKP